MVQRGRLCLLPRNRRVQIRARQKLIWGQWCLWLPEQHTDVLTLRLTVSKVPPAISHLALVSVPPAWPLPRQLTRSAAKKKQKVSMHGTLSWALCIRRSELVSLPRLKWPGFHHSDDILRRSYHILGQLFLGQIPRILSTLLLQPRWPSSSASEGDWWTNLTRREPIGRAERAAQERRPNRKSIP